MAATVVMRHWTGSGPTKNTVAASSNIRAATADVHSTNDTSNPIKIPANATAGYGGGSKNYSYWVYMRLQCTVAPATQLTNLKWYTTGSNNLGTGCGMIAAKAAGTNGTNNGYKQSSGTNSVSGDQLTTSFYNGSSGSGAPTGGGTPLGTVADAFTYTSGAALALSGSFVTGVDSLNNDFGDAVVWQASVDNTASPGTSPQTTLTISWDES